VPGRALALLVNLDLPVGRSSDGVGEVVDSDVGVGIERSTVPVGVDRGSHRFEIVADDEQCAAGRHRSEDVLDRTAVGCRGIDAYWAVTRSNAPTSNGSRALASAWRHSTDTSRRVASIATRSRARSETSDAVTCQP
jgi:hypothetical protein